MDFAETIRGIFGSQSSQPPPTGEDYASDLKPMVDAGAEVRRKPRLSFDLYPPKSDHDPVLGEELHDILRSKDKVPSPDFIAPPPGLGQAPNRVPSDMQYERPPNVLSENAARGISAGAVEPFGQAGRLMQGASEDPAGDLAGVGAAVAPIGPPGAGRALGRAAKVAEDYLPGIERLSVNSILHPDTAPMKQNSRTVEEIAKDLHDRGSEALRGLGVKSGRIEGPGEHDEIVSHGIAHEVEGALQRGGRNALDWYTSKIKEAMGHASKLYPEIASDPHHEMAFKAALAITSQGETVPNNLRLADQVYQHFRQTGRFPTDVNADKKAAMNSNFQKLNDMIDEHGLAGTKEFLGNKYKVKDLIDAGHKVTGENMDTMVHGSSILGPKIGGGFYQNLMGNFDPVTMDLWFMRGFGRLTGTLTGTATEKGLAKQHEAMERLLKEAGEKVPRGEAAMRKKAEDIMLTHERDFRNNRKLYDSGERQKSDLTKAADRWLLGRYGINETPGGGSQRAWMRDRVNRAREILESRGHKMTNADLQATWWYPEKELYGKLGGKAAQGLNIDYETAMRDLLRSRGKEP